MPAGSVTSRTTTLGPDVLAPVDRPSVRVLHFVKESCATASPDPTVTLNVRTGLAGLSEPEKVCVTLDGDGDGLGDGDGDGLGDGDGFDDGEGIGDGDGLGDGVTFAPPTGAESAEAMLVEPSPFVTVIAI